MKSPVNMTKTHQPRETLIHLFRLALNAVNGCVAVEKKLHGMSFQGDVAIIAIGKAAAAMALGAKNQLGAQIQSALIITKEGYGDSALGWECLEAGHPIPNEQSLEAGVKLLDFIKNVSANTKILALISGGTSALVEFLPKSMDLENLQKMNNWLLSSGLEIHDMNRIRQSVSLIKGGKVLNHLPQNKMTQFLISDVKNDELEIIGSGLFVASKEKYKLNNLPAWLVNFFQKPAAIRPILVESYIVASNEIACNAIIEQAKGESLTVTYHGQTLYGDVYELAELLVKELLNGEAGLHLWGGEPTIVLPDNPGRGGRNQSLALAMACLLENTKDITVLVAATDGGDGPGEDAGAIIDGLTLQRGDSIGKAKDYLTAADAGTFLAEAGDLISTGPTGTNVMDLVIAFKEPI